MERIKNLHSKIYSIFQFVKVTIRKGNKKKNFFDFVCCTSAKKVCKPSQNLRKAGIARSIISKK